MRYLLPCPQCGTKHPVDAMQAGERISCGCGASLEVPSLRGLRQLEPAQPPADSPFKPATRAKPAPGGGEIVRRLVFAGGLVLIALGLLLGSYAGLVRSQLPIAEPIADNALQAEALIDEFTPRETFDLWADFRDDGLGPYHVPGHYIGELWGKYYMRRIAIGLAIAGVGLLMTISALVIPVVSGRSRGH